MKWPTSSAGAVHAVRDGTAHLWAASVGQLPKCSLSKQSGLPHLPLPESRWPPQHYRNECQLPGSRLCQYHLPNCRVIVLLPLCTVYHLNFSNHDTGTTEGTRAQWRKVRPVLHQSHQRQNGLMWKFPKQMVPFLSRKQELFGRPLKPHPCRWQSTSM